jgi:hypothetical protein
VTARRSEQPLTRISVFLFDWQIAALDEISRQTLIPVSVFIRQGVDLILDRSGIAQAKAQPPKRRKGAR